MVGRLFDRLNVRNRAAVETAETMTLPSKVFRCSIKVVMNFKPSTACACHVGLSPLSVVAELHPPRELRCSPLPWRISRKTATAHKAAKLTKFQADFLKYQQARRTNRGTICPERANQSPGATFGFRFFRTSSNSWRSPRRKWHAEFEHLLTFSA